MVLAVDEILYMSRDAQSIRLIHLPLFHTLMKCSRSIAASLITPSFACSTVFVLSVRLQTYLTDSQDAEPATQVYALLQ